MMVKEAKRVDFYKELVFFYGSNSYYAMNKCLSCSETMVKLTGVLHYYYRLICSLTLVQYNVHCAIFRSSVIQGKQFLTLTYEIIGLFLPAVVRPMLDSMQSSKQVSPPALSDVSAN